MKGASEVFVLDGSMNATFEHNVTVKNYLVAQNDISSTKRIIGVNEFLINEEDGVNPRPPCLVLTDVGDTPHKLYVWVGSDGKLRIQAGSHPTHAGELGGTVVGDQHS